MVRRSTVQDTAVAAVGSKGPRYPISLTLRQLVLLVVDVGGVDDEGRAAAQRGKSRGVGDTGGARTRTGGRFLVDGVDCSDSQSGSAILDEIGGGFCCYFEFGLCMLDCGSDLSQFRPDLPRLPFELFLHPPHSPRSYPDNCCRFINT